VFTAPYYLSYYITQIRFVSKGLMFCRSLTIKRDGCVVSKADACLKFTGF